MIGDDPRLSGVDENSQSGASFPESGASMEDVVVRHAAQMLRESNAGPESCGKQLSRTTCEDNVEGRGDYQISSR
jgi:hypothetical protein